MFNPSTLLIITPAFCHNKFTFNQQLNKSKLITTTIIILKSMKILEAHQYMRDMYVCRYIYAPSRFSKFQGQQVDPLVYSSRYHPNGRSITMQSVTQEHCETQFTIQNLQIKNHTDQKNVKWYLEQTLDAEEAKSEREGSNILFYIQSPSSVHEIKIMAITLCKYFHQTSLKGNYTTIPFFVVKFKLSSYISKY